MEYKGLKQILLELRLRLIPAGSVILWGGVTIPSAYYSCDGRLLDSEDYPALYENIGTRHNTGGEADGKFRLPNQSDLGKLKYIIKYK